MVIVTTVLIRPLININIAIQQAVQLISQHGPKHSFSGSQLSFSQTVPGHSLVTASERFGDKREERMHMSRAVPVGLRSRGYYLNHFTDADRVSRHEHLLLDGDTAIDRSKGRYKTGKPSGICCCNSLCRCYLVCFVSVLIEQSLMGSSGYIPSTSEFSSGSQFLEFHRNFKNELSVQFCTASYV